MNCRLPLLFVVAVGFFLAVDVPLFGYTPPLRLELDDDNKRDESKRDENKRDEDKHPNEHDEHEHDEHKHDEGGGHMHDDEKKIDNEEIIKNMWGIGTEIDEELLAKLEDFGKHIKNKKWGKAIRLSITLPQDFSAHNGMFLGKDGFIVPIQFKHQELLLGIPAEGREAFHLFFDGKAKKLYRTISNSKTLGKKEMKIARRISTHYFFTSVGDNATELLGDVAFEQGAFHSAAKYYSMILKSYPDSEISELNLHVKHALALIRADRIEEAQTVIRVIAQQFPDKKIQIGGKPLLAKKYVLDFISADQLQPVVSSIPQNRLLGHSPVPIQKLKTEWQSSYLFSKLTKIIRNDYQNTPYALYTPCTPGVTSDSKKTYINYFGICIAINLESGKVIWMSQTFQKWHQQKKYRQEHYRQNYWNQFQIAIHNKIVIANCNIPGKGTHSGKSDHSLSLQRFQRLVAFDSATGKELWNSKEIDQLSRSSFLSRAIFIDDRFYVLSHMQTKDKYELHCIRTIDGKSLWKHSMPIVKGNDYRSANSVKSFSRYKNFLRIFMTDGSLINFNLFTKRVAWVFAAPPKPQTYNPNPFTSEIKFFKEESIIYMTHLKEEGKTDLIAIESVQKKLLWKHPVGKNSVLTGMDKQNLYLLSNEKINAIDRKTHQLKWSSNSPRFSGETSSIVTPENLLIFNGNGIYKINKANGKIVSIYREGTISLKGGRLFYTNNRIISLSDSAMTSYAFEQAGKTLPNKTSPNKKE